MSSARWHTQGHRIVYMAETPAGALIEMLVHLELVDFFPDTYQLLKVHVPDKASRERIEAASLGESWTTDANAATRALGDKWLHEARAALLEVPSAIVPETSNWLLNPEHADAGKVIVEWHRRFPYERRLRKLIGRV